MQDTILIENELPLKIEWHADGQLWASQNGKDVAVQVSRCFPWSAPNQYVSLRDSDNKEVALIDHLTELDSLSRTAIEKALAEAGFVFVIDNVVAIQADFEIRTWEVITCQGPRKFQTKLDDWPLALPGGGLLIRDVAGDLFFIDDVDKMDGKSQKLLWAFIG